MHGFTLAISCCVKTSDITSKFVKQIDVLLFKAVTGKLLTIALFFSYMMANLID